MIRDCTSYSIERFGREKIFSDVAMTGQCHIMATFSPYEEPRIKTIRIPQFIIKTEQGKLCCPK